MRPIHIFYNQAIMLSCCFQIYEDLQRKTVFVFVIVSDHILQICANFHKYWNNAMSNDGSSTKMIDQSYEDQAVQQVRMKSNIVFGRNLTTQSIVQSRQDRPDFCEKRARQYTVASKVLLKMKTLCNLRILKNVISNLFTTSEFPKIRIRIDQIFCYDFFNDSATNNLRQVLYQDLGKVS